MTFFSQVRRRGSPKAFFLALLIGALGASSLRAEPAEPESPAPSSAPSSASPSAAPSAGAPAAPSAEALATAKELFKNGVTLFNAGDMERALDYFLRSRAAFASSKNTINAAICLDRLGRYDEALELYEEVLTKFGADLDEDSRAAVAPAMTTLRQKVGTINVSANVEGAVLVDGRARGKLPLTAPLRVLAGKHVVRVLKDGYVTAETTVKVDTGQVVAVDLALKALAAAGLLRVEDPSNEGAEVFVDRVAVGTVPWEGTLGPGKHLVWTRKGDVGTGPTEATVVQGQTVLARMKSVPLGAPVRIEPNPLTAEVLVDGTALGPGIWEGRLPVGEHHVTVREPGYFDQNVTLTVPPTGGTPVKSRVTLVIDRNHPRWPRPGASGKFGIEAFAGYAWAHSLKATADDACAGTAPPGMSEATCSGNERARGFLGGLRGSYRFPFGLAIEAGGGYLALSASFSRILTTPKPNLATDNPQIRYYIDDELSLRGPFAAVGASYRLGIGKRFSATARVAGGMLFARSSDALSAQGRGTNTAPVDIPIVGGGSPVNSIAVLVAPEVGGAVVFGAFEVGLGFGALVVINDGPTLDNGKLSPDESRCDRQATNPDPVYCSSASNVVKSERAYGSGLLALTPQITASYTF